MNTFYHCDWFFAGQFELRYIVHYSVSLLNVSAHISAHRVNMYKYIAIFLS